MQTPFHFFVNFLYLFLKVSDGRNYPMPLSEEEEKKYFVMCQEGNESARAILIEHNLRLVAHIIKKYYSSTPNQEDLISIGTIGLIKAVDTYDMNKAPRFAGYAVTCVRNEIHMHFRAMKKTSRETSIDEPIEHDKEGNPITILDVYRTEDTIVEDLHKKFSSTKALKFIKDNLNERDREVITLRFGLHGEPAITQREVAKKLEISRSYVSRIETSALKKINQFLNNSPMS